MTAAPSRSLSSWRDDLVEIFHSATEDCVTLQMLGIGNEMMRDDGVGLFIGKKLMRKYGPHPTDALRIHLSGASSEIMLSRLIETGNQILIFDSLVENSRPGSIALKHLSSSRFGYFATHNIPLKLIPGLKEHNRIYVLGVEPESIDVGEELSEIVRRSALEVINSVGNLIENRLIPVEGSGV